jgi:hypothetical protein
MRLLLDVHLSGKVVAPALRQRGHDVRAANEERELDRLGDPDLLALAAQEQRILITGNIKDFIPITQSLAKIKRHHAGLILIPHHIHYGQFGRILTGLQGAFAEVPLQEDWLDRVHYLK